MDIAFVVMRLQPLIVFEMTKCGQGLFIQYITKNKVHVQNRKLAFRFTINL